MNIELKRQIVHASGILLILVLQIFGRTVSIALFFLGFMILAIWGYMRKYNISLGSLSDLERFFMKGIRGYERQDEYFKGPMMFALGALLSVILFPINVAAACIAVLAAGDSVSTLVGKTYGKHALPINRKKTWEGSIAFLIMAFIVLWFFDPAKAMYIAPIAMFVEMLPRVDDNLTIPLCVGLLFSL